MMVTVRNEAFRQGSTATKGQVIQMAHDFENGIEYMVRTVAGDFAEDFDIDAIVNEYIDEFNSKLHALGAWESLHADGSITEWDWMNEPGWDERHIPTEEELDEICDSIDLDALMAAHDISNN